VLRRIVQELAETGVEILQYRNKQDEDEVIAQTRGRCGTRRASQAGPDASDPE